MSPCTYGRGYGISYLPQGLRLSQTHRRGELLAVLKATSRFRGTNAREKAGAVDGEAGLEHVRKSKGWALSGAERGGEIGRALSINPASFLLDEPFRALTQCCTGPAEDHQRFEGQRHGI